MHWIWRSIIINSLVGFGIFIFIFYSETGRIPILSNHGLLLMVALLAFNIAGIALHYLSLYYNKILPWNRNITARFFIEVTSGLILLGSLSLIYSIIFLKNVVLPETETTFWEEYWDGAVKFGIVSLVMIYIYSLINFSIYSYNQYSKHQIDRLREERNQLNLQFEALKTQLSPHFLFNALNTISSLIYKDIALAEDFIRRLAHTYRYILKTNEHHLIPLKTELEMLNGFYFMQRIKFEDCIYFKYNIPESVQETLIPPLTLQMLMENALKHNLICDDTKLVVEIEATNDRYLLVRNNIIPKTQLLKIGNNLVDRPREIRSHKIGLSNIRERYAFFTNKKIDIIKNHDFTVKLPLIEPQREQETIL